MQSLTIPDVFCDRSLLFSVSDYVVLQAGLLSASDCFSQLFFADAAAEVLELVKKQAGLSARKIRRRYSHHGPTSKIEN